MEPWPANSKKKAPIDVFAGSSEMGDTMSSLDWSGTPLGPVETWSPCWRTAVSIALTSPVPTLLCWGPQLLILYNDAFIPFLGNHKHPNALGQCGREVFTRKLWDLLGPMLQRVFTTGQIAGSEQPLRFKQPNGEIEEAYFSFSHSPIRDENREVCGVFTTAIETRPRVVEHSKFKIQNSKFKRRQPPHSPSSDSSARILLVEDNPDKREYVKDVLERGGYEVEAVADGSAAIVAARHWAQAQSRTAATPDLIITDALESQGENFELLRELNTNPSTQNVPLVPISARSQQKVGADDLSGESPSDRELLDRVNSNLEMANLRLEQEAVPKQLLTLVESMTDGFATFDPQWRYTYINPAAARIVNKQPQELLGHRIWDIFPESVDSTCYRQYHRAVTEQVTVVFEEFYPALKKWYEIQAYPCSEGLSVYFQDITDRKRIEDELAHREQQFKAFAENAPDIIARIDKNLRHVYVNPAVEKVTGISRSEFINKTHAELGFPEEIYRPWQESLRNMFATGQKSTFEFSFPTSEGMRYYLSKLIPEFGPEGSVEYVLGISRDISDLKQTEAQLRQTNQILQTTIAASPLAIVALDSQANVKIWSPAAERIFGWSAAEVLDLPLPVIPEDRLEEFRLFHQKALQGRSVTGMEVRLRKKSGEEIDILVWESPLANEEGHITTTIALIADISDRKRTLLELQKERDFINAILNTIGSLVVVLDRQGRIVRFNHACEEITGYTCDEVKGAYLWDIFILPEAVENVQKVFENLRDVALASEYENDWVAKDGSLRRIAWSNTVLLDEVGEVEYVIGTGIDISDRCRAEEALRQSESKFRRLAQSNLLGILFADFQGNITDANDAFLEMMGYTQEELRSRDLRWDAMTPVELRELDAQKIQEIKTTGSCTPWEKEYIRKDGTRVPVLLGVARIEESQDSCVCFVLDLTERKKAEEALQQSTQRFRIAAENASDSIYEWEIGAGRLEWFGNIDEQLGYAAGEFPRTREAWYESIHPEDRDRVRAAVELHLQTREPFSQEYRIRRQDEIYLYWRDRGTALWDDLGRPYKWIGATTDITLTQWAQSEILKLTRALKRRVKELQTLLDVIPIGIGIADDRECTKITVNPAFAKQLKISSHENAALKALPEERSSNYKVYRNGEEISSEELPMCYAAAHGVEVLNAELDVIHEDGRIIKLLESAAPLFDEEGNTRGCVAALLDITERKQTEEALRNSEERYRSLAEALPQMVCLSTPQGTIEYCNQSWFDYTGLTLEQTQKISQQEIVHPDDRDEVVAEWQQALTTGEPCSIEFRLRRVDGIYRWHVARGVPIKGADDRIVAWLATATDTDDRKRAEEQERFLADASSVLAHSLDYQTTLENLASLTVPRMGDWCAIDVVEKDGSLQRLAVAHIDPAKVELARELFRRYPPKKNAPGVVNVIQTGQSELYPEMSDSILVNAAYDAEHLQILRNLNLSSAICVPLIARGRTLGAMTFVMEQGDRRYDRADLALAENLAHRAAIAIDNARLYREAQEANRLKDEFLATLSHELRTPLNSILGWAQILRNRKLSEEKTRSALETIERNARSQFQLIEDLLDVSRIITGKLRLNVTTCDLIPAIQAAIESVRPAAEAKQIRLEIVLEPNAGNVSGDGDRLQQIIWNLLSNAIKFTPNGGRVQVRLDREESHAQIAVTDTGQGMSADFLPYLFQRFRQADGGLTRSHGGLGLGLAIARHLVELHGGSIAAHSPGVGQGSTFTVRLPLISFCALTSDREQPKLSDETTNETNPLLDLPSSLDGVRVLLVDDEADAREFLCVLLEGCGARVQAVASVREALYEIEHFEPDVLLSDIAMPEEDGYTLIWELRQIERDRGGHLPAAALTAYARAEDRTMALKAGFEIHLPKPIEPAELIAVVESLAARTKMG